MTQSDFIAFYPQFSSFTPAVVLREYIAQANGRFSDFGESDAEEARRLYTAHKLTLYAFTVPAPDGSVPSTEVLASAGRAASRQVSSKKVGDVSVTYSETSSLSGKASSSLVDLAETAYGVQLLTLLRQYSRPRYIP